VSCAWGLAAIASLRSGGVGSGRVAAGEFDATAYAELAIDAGQVRLDGLLLDQEGRCDLGVGASLGDEFGDPLLGRGEEVFGGVREACPFCPC
jgi:hypothetical protein